MKQKSYTVHFNYHTYVEITVKASNATEALEKAQDELIDSKYNGDLLENIERDGDPEVVNDETGCEESVNDGFEKEN
jgi:hypothetical protein